MSKKGKTTREKAATSKASKKSAKSNQIVGIFGGTFNPFHLGHLNSLIEIQSAHNLSSIRVIPSFQTPGKPELVTPTPEERLRMAQLALRDHSKKIVVDPMEILRQGTSYTIDTIMALKDQEPKAKFVLILGADLFATLGAWKKFEKIIEEVDMIVTSRPGHIMPFRKSDLALELQPFVSEISNAALIWRTKKMVRFHQLKDFEISSTEVRKCVRAGLRVDKYLDLSVEKFIREKNLYKASSTNQLNFEEMTRFVAEVLFEKKAFHVKAYDLTQCNAPSEYAVIASGTSTRHVGSLGEAAAFEIKKKYGLNPLSIEGVSEGRWALVDFGGLIVHVFYDFVRQAYSLEQLWKSKKDLLVQDITLKSTGTFASTNSHEN